MVDGREILELIDRYDRASNDLESEAIARIQGAMDAAFRQLARELQTEYPRLQEIGGLNAAMRKTLVLERLGPLLDILDLDRSGEYEQLFRELLTTANQQGGSLADEMMRLYDSGAVAALEPFAGIPIEAVANQASEGVRRLRRYNEDFRDRASTIIGQGLIGGWGARRVEAALRSELGLAKGKAETIARTEVMASLNNSSIARYEQAGVGYSQWWNSPSEGLCGRCAVRNGRVYANKDIIYPLHPRDRCFLAPWSPEWQADGLTDDAFAERYRKEGFEQLKKNGLKPDYSLSSLEKNAGLSEAPKPAWSPGDPPMSVPQSPARPAAEPETTAEPSQVAPEPAPSPVRRASKPSYKSLPRDHAVTLNSRITAQRLDRALDALGTNGATERVDQLRRFIRKHDIQGVFAEPVSTMRENIELTEKLKFNPFPGDVGNVASMAGANGYTSPAFNHVTVTSDSSRRRTKPFEIDSKQLEFFVGASIRRAKNVTSRKDWSMSSVSRSGSDEQVFTTYLHELGHQIHFKAGYSSRATARFKPMDAYEVTDYAETNDYEWFAESFAAWMIDAETFRAFDPVSADFVEETLQKAIDAPSLMTE